MELKKYASIFGLLTMIGIVFGSFQEFASGGNFGFDWFQTMLWFAIGFPALVIISLLIWALATVADAEIRGKAS